MDYTVHWILQARVLEWVTFPFSRGSSQPKDQSLVSHIAGGFFTSWATRQDQEDWRGQPILSPADLPDPATELGSLALRADSLPPELPENPAFHDLGQNCREEILLLSTDEFSEPLMFMEDAQCEAAVLWTVQWWERFIPCLFYLLLHVTWALTVQTLSEQATGDKNHVHFLKLSVSFQNHRCTESIFIM